MDLRTRRWKREPVMAHQADPYWEDVTLDDDGEPMTTRRLPYCRVCGCLLDTWSSATVIHAPTITLAGYYIEHGA